MEIRDFAERLLFSDTIADKLCDMGPLTDHRPRGDFLCPDVPGRPKGLRPSETRRPFPTRSELDDPVRRGWLLHFFANHELLAIELMALALLRFPDAPPAFRRALTQTIADEQRHMRLYSERMGAMGVGFGEIPVNAFFWNCISSMQSPMDYVSRLSLTFEQANLDYALHWSRQFKQMGDLRTAEVLDLVYREEVEHVQIGLHWFKRWADPSRSLWSSYRDALVMPLSPSRAKGQPFSREAREAVGFSAHWIDSLALYRKSKGRPPDVWWFEPNLEAQIAGLTDGKAERRVATELGHLPLFLAASDDLVWVNERPPASLLRALSAAGFKLPEFAPLNDLAALAERKLGALRPWGWSPQSAQRCTLLGEDARSAWRPEHRALHSKCWAAARLAELSWPDGWPCSGADQVGEPLNAVRAIRDRVREGAWLVKAPWSTSGRQRRRLSGALSEADEAWLTRRLRTYGVLLVEPFLQRVVDLSAQAEVRTDGRVQLKGCVRFLTDPNGQFAGVYLGAWERGLSAELRRFVHGDGRAPRWAERALVQATEHVGQSLSRAGYRGPFGVDAMIYRDARGLRLKPIVEVNVRYTMGRLGLELRRRVKSSVPAVWRWCSTRRLERRGAGVQALRQLEAAHPIEQEGGQCVSGVLFTSAVHERAALLTCLLIGDRAIAAFEAL